MTEQYSVPRIHNRGQYERYLYAAVGGDSEDCWHEMDRKTGEVKWFLQGDITIDEEGNRQQAPSFEFKPLDDMLEGQIEEEGAILNGYRFRLMMTYGSTASAEKRREILKYIALLGNILQTRNALGYEENKARICELVAEAENGAQHGIF